MCTQALTFCLNKPAAIVHPMPSLIWKAWGQNTSTLAHDDFTVGTQDCKAMINLLSTMSHQVCHQVFKQQEEFLPTARLPNVIIAGSPQHRASHELRLPPLHLGA